MLYFEHPGKSNTAAAVKAALDCAAAQNIRKIAVASTGGETALHFKDCGKEIIVVSHQAGYKETGVQELTAENRQLLTEAGMKILTTTHLLAGVDRAVNYKFGGIYPAELIANSLRIMGQGFKVCVEIAVMAMDAGFIDAKEDIIAVGGSGKGADTAVLLRPAHSQYFFDTEIKEIICMPRGRGRD